MQPQQSMQKEMPIRIFDHFSKFFVA